MLCRFVRQCPESLDWLIDSNVCIFQFLEFGEMFFERVCGQVLAIEPIVPLVQRDTVVVNFSGKVNLP